MTAAPGQESPAHETDFDADADVLVGDEGADDFRPKRDLP